MALERREKMDGWRKKRKLGAEACECVCSIVTGTENARLASCRTVVGMGGLWVYDMRRRLRGGRWMVGVGWCGCC